MPTRAASTQCCAKQPATMNEAPLVEAQRAFGMGEPAIELSEPAVAMGGAALCRARRVNRGPQ